MTLSDAWARYHATLPEATIEPRNIQAKRDGKSYVYFIGGEGTPVKIGFSSQPHERLAILQTAHWCQLRILAMVEGSLATERDYHEKFGRHRMNGEWFEPHPDVLAEISRLQAETGR